MKVGLVLEGGALRTIFSSGVTDGFLKQDFMADYVVGVSAGIAYGVSYLSKQFGRNLEILTKYANDKRYMGKRNLLRPGNRSYFGLKFSFEDIPNQLVPFDFDTFSAFPGQAEAVVTNLNTGEADYLPVSRQDEHFLLLQATCAMPLLFPVYHLNGNPYLDGGAADAIPYQRALDMGCDKLVVVLTRERTYRRKPEALQPTIDLMYRKYPNFCRTMRHRAERYNSDRERLFRLEREGRALIYAPYNTEGFSRIEKNVEKIRALWQSGYDQSIARADELKHFLAD